MLHAIGSLLVRGELESMVHQRGSSAPVVRGRGGVRADRADEGGSARVERRLFREGWVSGAAMKMSSSVGGEAPVAMVELRRRPLCEAAPWKTAGFCGGQGPRYVAARETAEYLARKKEREATARELLPVESR